MSNTSSTYSNDGYKVNLETDEEGLAEVLEAFECFLKGCGFNFNGHLEIIEEDES